MLIDWFTVVAQIINFLILLALLKWLLFDRVVRAMDEREEKIATRIRNAQQKQDDVEQRIKALDRERQEFEANQQQRIEEAGKEAQDQRRELLKKAREEVERSRSDWEDALRRDQQEVIDQLGRQAGQGLQKAMRQALQDLADADLEDSIVRAFLNRVRDMDNELRQQFHASLESGKNRVEIVSARPLSEDMQRAVAEALETQLDHDVKTVFDESPDLLAGLELRINGHALAWNLDRYLEGFQDALRQSLQGQTQTVGETSE